MRTFYSLALAVSLLMLNFASAIGAEAQTADKWLAPPATPLVACDPYFSIWSPAKTLPEADTVHWTGKPHRLVSLVRIDGTTYRVMGGASTGLDALEQKSLQVWPTRTLYTLTGGGVQLDLTFTTPSIPYDVDLLSRPITYINYEFKSLDGKQHDVQVGFFGYGEIAVNSPEQKIEAKKVSGKGWSALEIGSVDQNVLGRRGDDLRIDWGYFYLCAQDSQIASSGFGTPDRALKQFSNGNGAKNLKPSAKELPAADLAGGLTLKSLTVGKKPVSQWLVTAYDDLYSIEFMRSKLRPYWRRNGLDANGLLSEAIANKASLDADCVKFDDELMQDLTAMGGEQYAQICALAYRQCFAAGKFVADAKGQPIQFCKENHSNGCIGTSDVFYPMAPQFLMFGPTLGKSFVAPFMEYAASDRWTFPFAPHDLGTYPKANGQVYGGGETSVENQMPVEESGNMLLLVAAIAQTEGNADFASRYWPQLTQWAEYLKDTGFDPDRQLCTDDFAGHMAHNVNLSAKAICGLGAFAKLCELRGDVEMAEQYWAIARQYAARWKAEAADGDHYRLAFDKPGTWSQKYNLVWDKVLGLNLFSDDVLETEMKYYREIQNRYGLPLDNRREYTKLDWVLWTASLTENQEDFEALVAPVYRFLEETPNRAPMTDWYETVSGKKVGFTARPVVGGVFMQVLHDADVWQKWASRDVTKAGDYAAMPIPPKVEPRLAAADTAPAVWQYTFLQPTRNWFRPDFDDSRWKSGESGFGVSNTPGAIVGTRWDNADIWLRRSFDMPDLSDEQLYLHIHHDEAAEVYINGQLVAQLKGYSSDYDQIPLSDKAVKVLKKTGNVLAVHCHQTDGGQYIDVGLSVVIPAEQK